MLLFLDVCKQTFHISQERISQKVKSALNRTSSVAAPVMGLMKQMYRGFYMCRGCIEKDTERNFLFIEFA